MRKMLFTLLLCLFMSGTILAQTFGDISGEVRDQSNAVICGVVVTLTNVGTNATRTTESNVQGI